MRGLVTCTQVASECIYALALTLAVLLLIGVTLSTVMVAGPAYNHVYLLLAIGWPAVIVWLIAIAIPYSQRRWRGLRNRAACTRNGY